MPSKALAVLSGLGALLLLSPVILFPYNSTTVPHNNPTITPTCFIYLPIVVENWPRTPAPPATQPPPTPTTTPMPPEGDLYEPDDTAEQANWIQDGETQTHSIIPATDVDWVKFSVNTESEVIIEAADEGGDLELWLYDSNLNVLGHDYSGINDPARINCECGIWGNSLAAGMYYARAEHYSNPWGGGEIPRYDITLTVNPCPTPVILANYSHWTAYSDLIIAGEVQNDGEIGLYSVRVTANLFDNNGLIDTGTGYAALDVLPLNDRTCFRIELDEVSEWSYYEFETPTYYLTSDKRLQNMTVYGDSGTHIDGSYKIVGFIRNDNDFQVKYVQPIATLYDASGVVIGCRSTDVSSIHLDPGQSSSFEFNFYSWNWNGGNVASYRIQVGGDPQ